MRKTQEWITVIISVSQEGEKRGNGKAVLVLIILAVNWSDEIGVYFSSLCLFCLRDLKRMSQGACGGCSHGPPQEGLQTISQWGNVFQSLWNVDKLGFRNELVWWAQIERCLQLWRCTRLLLRKKVHNCSSLQKTCQSILFRIDED